MIIWELQRPEPVQTGSVTLTALYTDGVTVIPSGIVQLCNADGSGWSEISFENGTFGIEKPAGDYIINIVIDGIVVGTLNIHINAGDGLTQSVVTN